VTTPTKKSTKFDAKLPQAPAAVRPELAGPAGAVQRALLAWYRRCKRDLPWRGTETTAYHILVSELMLQQTQVATVVPYYQRWLARFPDVATLAAADEAEVLKLWQGLGYYRRARFLHRAAKEIVARFGGQVPKSLEELLSLPGVGRYTAGAVRSIGHGLAAPIVDGNVMRVVCRLDGIRQDPVLPVVQARLWERAEQLAPRGGKDGVFSADVADFSSALMELGATVCRPSSPECETCPLGRWCNAKALGLTDSIPPAKKRKAPSAETRYVFAVAKGGKLLVRPCDDGGRWAGLFELPTAGRATEQEPTDRSAPPQPAGLKLGQVRYIASIGHTLTHRKYTFHVYSATHVGGRVPAGYQFASVEQLRQGEGGFPVSRATEKVLDLLAADAQSLWGSGGR
jgi:A/G-specific adenine glycosylase